MVELRGIVRLPSCRLNDCSNAEVHGRSVLLERNVELARLTDDLLDSSRGVHRYTVTGIDLGDSLLEELVASLVVDAVLLLVKFGLDRGGHVGGEGR